MFVLELSLTNLFIKTVKNSSEILADTPYRQKKKSKQWHMNTSPQVHCATEMQVTFNPLISPRGAYLFQPRMRGGLIETGGIVEEGLFDFAKRL